MTKQEINKMMRGLPSQKEYDERVIEKFIVSAVFLVAIIILLFADYPPPQPMKTDCRLMDAPNFPPALRIRCRDQKERQAK
jgi:hypothetical protein